VSSPRILHPKLIGLARFAFSDALYFRRVQAVQLVVIFGLLLEQALYLVQQAADLGLELRRHLGQLARYVAPDPAHQRLELLQVAAHALVLSGMGVAGNLARQFGRFPVVVLA